MSNSASALHPHLGTNEIRYSLGIGATDIHPKQLNAASFKELAVSLRKMQGPKVPSNFTAEQIKSWKASAPIPWIAQPMSGDGRRGKANASPWPLLILDIDQVQSLSQKEAWDVLRDHVTCVRSLTPCFGWFTASHTREAPRARLVALLNRNVTPTEAKSLAEAINTHCTRELGISVGFLKDDIVTLDPTMQHAGHIAFGPLEGAGWIELHEDAPPLDVDKWIAASVTSATSKKVKNGSGGEISHPARELTSKAIQEVGEALLRIDARHPTFVHDRTHWLEILCALKAHGWPDSVMEPIARTWSEQSPKFDANRWATDWVSLKIEGGITPSTLYYFAGQADSDCPAFGTDDGFACRFCEFLDGRAMWARSRFYTWAGSHWRQDNGQIAAWLKDFAREQATASAKASIDDPTDSNKAQRAKTSKLLLQQNVQDRVLRATATMLRVDDAELDHDDFLLACTNGTLDLRTGALKPPDPEDHITLCTGHAFDETAESPTWDAFILEALGNAGTADWFQRYIGYSATGDVREELMLLALGPSGTGKSTSLKAIMHALGGEIGSTSYCTAAASALLSDSGKRRSANEHTGGLTPLVGRRLVAVNEVKRGEAWDDALLKQLVSREPIQMREVGGARAFTVLPTWKIWVRGNHRPNIRDVTDAFFRRVAVLEFKCKPSTVDQHLDSRLRMEAPGILAWIVRGAIAWQQRGLSLPPIMQAALDSYRSEQDLFGEWLVTRTEPAGFTTTEVLRHDYSAFAGITRHPPSTKAFAGMMRERGYDPKKYRGERGYPVTLQPDGELQRQEQSFG